MNKELNSPYQLSTNETKINRSFIQKAIALEIMTQIQNGKDIKSIYYKDNILSILNRLKSPDSQYYLCHLNIPNLDENVIHNFSQNEKYLYECIEKTLKDKIDYDVEFYKLGQKCNGLRKRYAIIMTKTLFSSKEPYLKFNKSKAKNKSHYLENSKVYLESYENYLKLNEKNQPEWTNKTKPYRMKINYKDNKKNKFKSFFLYFTTYAEMKEVEEVLFGVRLTSGEIEIIQSSFTKMECCVNDMFNFYAMLKVLSVKENIIKKKIFLNKIKNESNQNISALFNICQKSFSEKLIQKYKIRRNMINDNTLYYLKEVIQSNENIDKVFRSKISDNYNQQVEKINDYLITNNYTLSQFQPMIIPLGQNNLLDKGVVYNKKNALYSKFNTHNKVDILFNNFKKIFNRTNSFINNNNPNESIINPPGIAFDIEPSTVISNSTKQEIINSNIASKANLLIIDKSNGNIILSSDGSEQTTFSYKSIQDISNVLINIPLDDKPNHTVHLFGPRKDANKYLTYQLENDLDNNIYVDPSQCGLKYDKQNLRLCNEVVIVQIFQIEYEIKRNEIEQLQNTYNISISNEHPENDLLFYIQFLVHENKVKRSNFFKAKIFIQDHFIIEINQEFIFPLTLFENKDDKIEIFIETIPEQAFDVNSNEYDKTLISKYIKTFNLGESEITKNKIDEKVNKYIITKNYKKFSESSIILINCIVEQYDSSLHEIEKNYFGKDYCIGSDMYITEIVTKSMFDQNKKKPNISQEFIDEYYNIEFDDDDSFLFRPREDMTTEQFVNDIKDTIPNKIIKKILRNQKYKFLPQCEKFSSEKALNQSLNLIGLTTETKKELLTYKVGEWIYKADKLRVRILSKNLGCTKHREITQLLYLPSIRKKIKLSLNNNRDFNLLDENGINIIDIDDIKKDSLSNCNKEDFLWSLSLKFKNKIQINTFIKLLKQLRQKANMKDYLAQCGQEHPISINKVLSSLNINAHSDYIMKIYINKIEFRDIVTLNDDSKLIAILNKMKSSNQSKISINKCGETLLDCLYKNFYQYKNSISKDPLIQERISSIKNMQQDSFELKPQIILNQNQFNSGQKLINFKNLMYKEIEIKSGFDKLFEIEINLKETNGTYQIKKYYSEFSLDNLSKAEEMMLPIYEKDQYGDTNLQFKKIYGILHLKLWKIKSSDEHEKQLTFDEAYLHENKDKIQNFIFFEENSNIPISKGRYEPNITRRKILTGVKEKFNISLSELLITLKNDNSLAKSFYRYIDKKCIEHQPIEQIKYFDINNIKLNFSTDLSTNSYNKKIILKLIQYQKKEEFYNLFSKSEWFFFFKNNISKTVSKFEDNIFEKFPKDKKDLFRNDALLNELRDLIFLGYPTKESRIIAWEYFLNIKTIFQLTKEKINQLYQKSFSAQDEIFDFYKFQIQSMQNTNILFTLIDNDTNYIKPLIHSDGERYEYIESVKTIAKAYFLWTNLNICLNSNKESKYVYFVGILSIIQRFKYYFNSDSKTFWFLIGLSQYIELFQQVNPLYCEDMSYINLYVLVTKLIMESHCNDIFLKFNSLNYPIEQFISKQLNSLYSDYFQSEVLFNFFDVLILEASYSKYVQDPMIYLRILCATPVTLFQMNRKKILLAQTISELETIFDDFILKTYNSNIFISNIYSNVNNFFTISGGIFEKWLGHNQNSQWDDKRHKLQSLYHSHFQQIQYENITYLSEISKLDSILGESKNFVENYFQGLCNKLDVIRKLYGHGTPSSVAVANSKTSGIALNIGKILLNGKKSNVLKKEMKIVIKSADCVLNKENDNIYSNSYENVIIYDTNNERIQNISELHFDIGFEFNLHKYINIFVLNNDNDALICQFVFNISKCEIMEINKINLESLNEGQIKCILEISYIKYSLELISSDDLVLFQVLFSKPFYYHNTSIENLINSYYPLNTIRSLKNDLCFLTQNRNNVINKITTHPLFQSLSTICDIYRKNNIISEYPDAYCLDEINSKIIERNSKDAFKLKISGKVEELLTSLLTNEHSAKTLMNWLKDTNLSFEEMLYSLVLVDKGSFTIHEKMYLLFSIAQMKNKLLFNSDKASIIKIKEMFYALYKRYMIYFTKSDIDRMVDFSLKDEKILNIKYVLLYSDINEESIDAYIHDRDRFNLLNNQENLYFSNLTSKFICFANYLNNHYNLLSLDPDIVIYILRRIIENDLIEKQKEYSNKQFNYIKIVVARENIQYIRKYKIDFDTKRGITTIKEVSPKILNNNNLIDLCLSDELNNLELYSSYSNYNEVSYGLFKKIFFNLPFLPDLLRTSCVFISENKKIVDKVFDQLIISIKIQNEVLACFYFPECKNNSMINCENVYNTGTFAKSSMTLKHLRDIICNENRKSHRSGRSERIGVQKMNKYLAQPKLFEAYIVNRKDNSEERILYFENLNSNLYLKNQTQAEIRIYFKPLEMSYFGNDITQKQSGYAKFYINGNGDYEWRKCKIIPESPGEVLYESYEYFNSIKLNAAEYMKDFLGEGLYNINI